jgi:hypothetical protein
VALVYVTGAQGCGHLTIIAAIESAI